MAAKMSAAPGAGVEGAKGLGERGGKGGGVAPNQTLYLTNLPEKIAKHDLRRLLYTLFATHGPVLDVNAMRSPGMRGQAHVAFRDVQTATVAMRALQGGEMCGKAMKIQYAKGKTDTIAKLDGTYKMPVAGGEAVGVKGTDLQKEVFGGVPGSAAAAAAKTDGEMDVDGGPKGTKRGREEDDDDDEGSDEGAPMEQDSDDAPMEEDSDEDEE